MITFIIPTLWKSPYIHITISEFIKIKNPDIELILVDNANSNFYVNDPRILIIKSSKNLFVNPSWNLGVNLSKNEIVCLVNDDILFNFNTILYNLKNITKNEFGVLGISMEMSNIVINKNDDIINLIQSYDHKPTGFGCFMITTKTHWTPIPDEIKVFYGDDWIYWGNIIEKKKNYLLNDLKWIGKFGTTSDNFYDEFMTVDNKIYGHYWSIRNDKQNKLYEIR